MGSLPSNHARKSSVVNGTVSWSTAPSSGQYCFSTKPRFSTNQFSENSTHSTINTASYLQTYLLNSRFKNVASGGCAPDSILLHRVVATICMWGIRIPKLPSGCPRCVDEPPRHYRAPEQQTVYYCCPSSRLQHFA